MEYATLGQRQNIREIYSYMINFLWMFLIFFITIHANFGHTIHEYIKAHTKSFRYVSILAGKIK
jgi:hypothetical protein